MFSLSLLCSCPVAAELPVLTLSDCPFAVGQIQKIILQRKYSSGSTLNVMSIANAELEANWTILFNADNGTKVVISPYIEEPTSEGGEPRTYGGGNVTVGGVTRKVGKNPTAMSMFLVDSQSVLIEQLQDYPCENLAVYLVTENDKIIGLTDSNATPVNFYPIPIVPNTFFISDRKLGGYEAPDRHQLMWDFAANWDLKLYSLSPSDFSPLSDFTNPST